MAHLLPVDSSRDMIALAPVVGVFPRPKPGGRGREGKKVSVKHHSHPLRQAIGSCELAHASFLCVGCLQNRLSSAVWLAHAACPMIGGGV